MDFSKLNGLVPAVIQDDANGDVLMVGFMNAEALERTVALPDEEQQLRKYFSVAEVLDVDREVATLSRCELALVRRVTRCAGGQLPSSSCSRVARSSSFSCWPWSCWGRAGCRSSARALPDGRP